MTKLLSQDETAQRLAVLPTTLTKWRHRRRGPAFLKIGGRVRYAESDVEAFLASSRVVPSSEGRKRRRR